MYDSFPLVSSNIDSIAILTFIRLLELSQDPDENYINVVLTGNS